MILKQKKVERCYLFTLILNRYPDIPLPFLTPKVQAFVLTDWCEKLLIMYLLILPSLSVRDSGVPLLLSDGPHRHYISSPRAGAESFDMFSVMSSCGDECQSTLLPSEDRMANPVNILH